MMEVLKSEFYTKGNNFAKLWAISSLISFNPHHQALFFNKKKPSNY